MMNRHEAKIATSTVFQGAEVSSIDEVLQRSNTDWDVSLHEAGGGAMKSGGFRAIVRPDTNTALAFVGDRYRTNSHRAQLQELDGFVRSGDLIPSSVSVWDNGAMLAYQFRAPQLDMVIQGRDVVSPLLTLAFAYGSQLADTAFFADFRWFCKNQMGAVSKLITDRVKHRGNIVARYGDLLGTRLGALKGELADRYRAMRAMPTKALQGRALVEFFGQSIGATPEEVDQAWVMPTEELTGKAAKVPEIIECYMQDDCGAEGSVWQAYNAVTRYESHVAGRTPESRNRRMLLGAGGEVAAAAFSQAARLVA